MIPAAKWGTLLGVGSYLILTIGLTLLDSAFFGTSPVDLNHPGPLTFTCLGIFAILFAFSTAGYFTGRETRQVGWGVVSAMIALTVYYLLGRVYTPGRSSMNSSTASQLPFVAQLLFAGAAAVLVLLVAAGMGWLGARPAVQQAQKRLERPTTSKVKDIATTPDTTASKG